MNDFEKLGVFYLGREYDVDDRKMKDDLLLYDSKDLVTHAVCVGMTGSGKTGLGIGLLEEAAIDGIPAIIVDPKGDLTNLLLTFPNLKPDDFLPWINADDARKKDLSPEEFAAKQAELWKNGLAQWEQDGARIRRLRDAAEFAIYTPGSEAGIPVSILESFAAPDAMILEDTDLIRERINTTVTSLLSLMGIEADPLQSREHILLSNILNNFWQQGKDLDLAGLINAIQSPPMTKIGVFDLESFFPSKDRFGLAMKLNNLLAAPGFDIWLKGEALDIDRILFASNGKPRMSIFSIAHLNDAERMFFVSLLLTQILGWMRTQSGTTSLRSLFYMDEIFGYFPPVANPPSKAPLLSLLKQARAFGLGIVLATQNPVDLDYKGLSNTGTWFIGRLQTDRDKQRVLDGLEGANVSGGFNRRKMEQILAGLGKRVFLMNNVHETEPVIFHTRWVMSYLRGPLTRNQIKKLMADKKKFMSASASEPQTKTAAQKKKSASQRPAIPPEIPQYFYPIKKEQSTAANLFYEPMLMGIGSVYFTGKLLKKSVQKNVSLLADFPDGRGFVNWEQGKETNILDDQLNKEPERKNAEFGEPPSTATNPKNYQAWSKDFKEWLYRNKILELWTSRALKMNSFPGESERDFRIRLQMIARERRDEMVEKLRKKYAAKMQSIETKIQRAEFALEREQEQAKQQKVQTVISLGTTLLGAFLGRKAVSRSTVGRATTAARGASRAMKEAKDVARAERKLEDLQRQMENLQGDLAREIEDIKAKFNPLTEELDIFELTPKKSDVSVSLVALTWVPYWLDNKGGMRSAF
ncbi:MAG: ATP-binding protein [Calditrichaeota bacterium]|nr:ATP-binding protein [Calditrichota bacterium]